MKSRHARPDGCRGSLFGSVALGLSVAVAGTTPAHAQQTPTAKAPAGKSRPADGLSLRNQLRAQRLATRKARAIYEIARLTRELAEIAVEEYSNEEYVRELSALDRKIQLARIQLQQAEANTEWARRANDKGLLVLIPHRTRLDLDFRSARLALDQAEQKKSVLVNYTRVKTVNQLENSVKKARGDEAEKRAVWQREEARESDMERRLAGK